MIRGRRGLIKGACAIAALFGAAGVVAGIELIAPPRAAAASSRPWLDTRQSAERRAVELLGVMSFVQKLTLVSSDSSGVPELGIPPLTFTDGPNGVGDGSTHVTSWCASRATSQRSGRGLGWRPRSSLPLSSGARTAP